jgi:hypothetical protein
MITRPQHQFSGFMIPDQWELVIESSECKTPTWLNSAEQPLMGRGQRLIGEAAWD